MTVETDLENILANMNDPRNGLPDEVFQLIRKVTPLINVDLLIAATDARFSPGAKTNTTKGGNIPGGIVRFRETFQSRIDTCALTEIGATVESEPSPCNLAELRQYARGHFISLLYRCSLTSEIDPARF